jgi:hypothetical protein
MGCSLRRFEQRIERRKKRTNHLLRLAHARFNFAFATATFRPTALFSP